MLVVRTLAALNHCRSCLVFLTGSLLDLALVMIYSLASELPRALNSQVFDFMSFLHAEITFLTKIIFLKCTCFSFLLDLVCVSFLDFFCRVFNR